MTRLVPPLTLLILAATPASGVLATPTTEVESKALRKQAQQHFQEGKKRFALRQFRRALQSFSRAYEALPLSGFLFNIGQCHRFLGDCKKAVFFYSGFVRENPGTPDASFVKKLIERCRVRQAKIRAKRSRATTLFEEGRRAFTLQQYDEALAKYTAAYKVVPLPGFLFHLGEAHRQRKTYVKAIHFYESYLKQNPGSPKVKSVKTLVRKCRELQEAQDRAAGRINRNLGLGGGSARPPARPVYKKWWFWTVLATGVAAAVGLGVGLGMRDNGSGLPDATFRGTW